MRKRWHIQRNGESFTLSRALPPRFDVQASTRLPMADPVRLAHQIRQDVWRALQAVRGFSPVVRLEPSGEALKVTAGGRVDGRVPPNASAVAADVLSCPNRRKRWVRHAMRGRVSESPFDRWSESPS